ncbi:MAG: hypothetical protein KGK33_04630 [Hyphomicrobiales bacterium]|nr:hypothetical protein [Hyphomicrobiales bacterium]
MKRNLIIAPAVAWATALFVSAAVAQLPSGSGRQPCDPLIDGTYCATQGGRAFGNSASSSSLGSVQSLSGDLSLGQEQPATFAGVSFSSNNTVCIGLLRRSACN